MAATLLKVSGLKVAYGGIQAVKGVDFEVHEGELVTLIGSNGAGKTTTMKAITGTLGINAGDIQYLGEKTLFHVVGEGQGDSQQGDLLDDHAQEAREHEVHVVEGWVVPDPRGGLERHGPREGQPARGSARRSGADAHCERSGPCHRPTRVMAEVGSQ